MIHLSVGLPGRLAAWCDAALTRLAALSGQSVTSITLPGLPAQLLTLHAMAILNEAALCLVRGNAAHIVVGARFPDEGLFAALRQSHAPFVLALDDPRLLVGEIMAEAGETLVATTRAVANLCPLVMRYMALPNGLAVRPCDARENGASTILAMARHFGIAVSEDQAHAISQDLPSPTGANLPALGAEDQQTLDGALGAYAAHFAGAPLGDIVWTGALFSLAYNTARAPNGPIPMRETDDKGCLIQGPFMRLPPGAWVAQIALRVSPEGVGQTMTLDLCSSRQLAAGKSCPVTEDIHTTEMPFTIDDITWRDIQLRIFAIRERMPGRLSFTHVLMHPVKIHQSG